MDWVSVFINWFPMLLLIGAWFIIMAWMRRGGFQTKYQTEYLQQMRANTAALERIAAALERRGSN